MQITTVPASGGTPQDIGTFPTTITPLNPNQALATLTNFNATQLLTVGTYQANFTYFPSPNFTQPTPLIVNFQITARAPFLPLPMPLVLRSARRCAAHAARTRARAVCALTSLAPGVHAELTLSVPPC